jgi:hypothetical protein
MSDSELRDAALRVDVELPNGTHIAGRPVYFRTGMALQAKMDDYVVKGTQKSFDVMFDAFREATGITEDEIQAGCPTITVPEIMDLIRRFIYLLRPGRTAAQVPGPTPASTAAPVLPAPPAAQARRRRKTAS